MFLIRVSLIALILISSSTFGFGVTAQGKQITLSGTDKASIISLLLKRELAGKGESRVNQTIYLSTENIAEALTTGLTPSKLVLLTPEHIQRVGLRGERLAYLRFSKPEVKGQRVRIILGQYTTKDGYSGTEYECRRRSGRWICKGIRGFNVSS